MYIDWVLLNGYGLTDRIRNFITFGPWERLFSIREKVYKNLTLEVLSTLKFQNPDAIHGLNNTIEFMVLGEQQSVSMTQFCIACGLYTKDEVETEDFQQLNHHLPYGIQNKQLWEDWSRDPKPYNPSISKGSLLKETEWRIVHWLLSHSITGRGQSTGVVNAQDLMYLYSLIKRFPMNIGVQLAFYIRRQANDNRCGTISCGAFITHLIKNLGLFPDPPPPDEIVTSVPLAESAFKNWKLLADGLENEQSVPQQQNTEQAHTRNQASTPIYPQMVDPSGVPWYIHFQMMKDHQIENFKSLSLSHNTEYKEYPDLANYWPPPNVTQDSEVPLAPEGTYGEQANFTSNPQQNEPTESARSLQLYKAIDDTFDKLMDAEDEEDMEEFETDEDKED